MYRKDEAMQFTNKDNNPNIYRRRIFLCFIALVLLLLGVAFFVFRGDIALNSESLSEYNSGYGDLQADPEQMASEQTIISASHTNNDFVLSIFADRAVYSIVDPIQIWATLEYIGDNTEITIWHSLPLLVFTISDNYGFNFGDTVSDVLEFTDMQRGAVLHFDYQKSGYWDSIGPYAALWETFFREDSLFLPPGEYTVTVVGAFSLNERMTDMVNDLVVELNIRVV